VGSCTPATFRRAPRMGDQNHKNRIEPRTGAREEVKLKSLEGEEIMKAISNHPVEVLFYVLLLAGRAEIVQSGTTNQLDSKMPNCSKLWPQFRLALEEKIHNVGWTEWRALRSSWNCALVHQSGSCGLSEQRVEVARAQINARGYEASEECRASYPVVGAELTKDKNIVRLRFKGRNAFGDTDSLDVPVRYFSVR
jgi:hypothetical protein